jgi:hypothetical protein
MANLAKLIEEFNFNVWNHTEDDFQMSFDDRRHLTVDEISLLKNVTDLITDPLKDSESLNFLQTQFIQDDGKSLALILQICGLTRNKILQDLKAMVGSNRTGLSLSSYKNLYTNNLTWSLAGAYLIKKMRTVLLAGDEGEITNRVFQALNQATWPGYIRQERAKRSGHEAEGRMATILSNLQIAFEPTEKADNPMCKDAQINEVSFDLIVPSASNPLLCIKSTVHTANIGQYGESKDHLEIDEARRMIDSFNHSPKPKLVAFIDGVGFESNKAGLMGVLSKSDEFVQFKSIWKLVVMSADVIGKKCELDLDVTHNFYDDFFETYKTTIIRANLKADITATIAGEALVKVI